MNSRTVKAIGFKQALRSTIDAGPLPAKAVADLMEISYGQLMSYADLSQDVHLPSSRIARLLSLCPDLSLVTYLAPRRDGGAPAGEGEWRGACT